VVGKQELESHAPAVQVPVCVLSARHRGSAGGKHHCAGGPSAEVAAREVKHVLRRPDIVSPIPEAVTAPRRPLKLHL